MEIHQSLVGRCLLSYMLLILQKMKMGEKSYAVTQCTIYTVDLDQVAHVQVPPMNLQAN